MMGHYSPTDTNRWGTHIPPLTPMMGHYSSTDTNDGLHSLPLIPMMNYLFLIH
ncbi:unnamed protein product [Staurois parvus]|uniref:Uncharacterized protein n=1 Tax=Staurois parvus TaxID=386267 RepID=A0ABN9DNT2_9NEOB|nr:unnamed protein product [Staurois parvus]